MHGNHAPFHIPHAQVPSCWVALLLLALLSGIIASVWGTSWVWAESPLSCTIATKPRATSKTPETNGRLMYTTVCFAAFAGHHTTFTSFDSHAIMRSVTTLLYGLPHQHIHIPAPKGTERNGTDLGLGNAHARWNLAEKPKWRFSWASMSDLWGQVA